MMSKHWKKLASIILSTFFIAGYFLFQELRPVEIIAVHQDENFSSVLVKNFPLTDKGKINWWLHNKEMLKSRYNIPIPASYGNFSVVFWLFGDGYKEAGKYDRRCFNDMNTKINCIEKEAVFSVKRFGFREINFATYNGNYRLNRNNEIVFIDSD